MGVKSTSMPRMILGSSARVSRNSSRTRCTSACKGLKSTLLIAAFVCVINSHAFCIVCDKAVTSARFTTISRLISTS
eukprot:Skav219441  [mRNA]  locus=scaffold1461:138666:140267:- [translate_table: standard]